VGVTAGVLATAVYASTKGWLVTLPALAWGSGFGAALAIGALAGLLPALRAAAVDLTVLPVTSSSGEPMARASLTLHPPPGSTLLQP